MFISPAYGQSLFGDGGSGLVQLAPLLLIFVVFYFFMIRPQQQRQKQHRVMLDALRRGDRIVTAGGILGTVARVLNDNEVAVDIAEGVRVRVVRSTITQILAKTEPAAKTRDTAADEDDKNDDKKTGAAGGD